MTRTRLPRLALLILVFCLPASGVRAENLTIGQAGRVTIELLGAFALYNNTLSLVPAPGTDIAETGCKLEPADGLTGMRLLSERLSQRGCRTRLDADDATDEIEGFAAGTVFEFNMCAQTDDDDECEFVWSSDPAKNPDGFDHVETTELHPGDFPGRIFRLAWEDIEDGGDLDFNDLIVVVRVELDSDGDGLWDDWETFGIDTDGDDDIDLDLPALGADPMRKNLFVEIDYMACDFSTCSLFGLHFHIPKGSAIDAVVEAFEDAPVPNPDGSTGIDLHIDVDDALEHQDYLSIGCSITPDDEIADFDDVKAANFDPNRRFAFTYGVFGHQQAPDNFSSGCAERPGNDFLVTLGGWDGNVGSTVQQAGTLMHEFGHTLGLRHGGDDLDNYKPNYQSVMNYRFQTRGIPDLRLVPPFNFPFFFPVIDFSSEDLDDLDESNLDEDDGIGATSGLYTRYNCPSSSKPFGGERRVESGGSINWDCDGDGDEASVSVNINRDCVDANADDDCDDDEAPVFSVLSGFDDWANLHYGFQSSDNYEDGDHSSNVNLREIGLNEASLPVADAGSVADGNPVTPPGPPFEPYACVLGDTIDLDGSGSFDPIGMIEAYEWDFLGGGAVDATGAEPAYACVSHVADVPVSLVVTDDDDHEAQDGAIIQVGVDVGPDRVVECSEPVALGIGLPDSPTLSYAWTHADDMLLGETPEINPVLPLGDNLLTLTVTDERGESVSDELNVHVEDTTPPEISLSVSPDKLWPPNHKLRTVTADVEVTDACDPDPSVTLVSITSSEPDDGLGDGNTNGDVQGAGLGTEDYEFELRAERSGRRSGRVYEIVYRAEDQSGNTADATATVTVGHDKRK